MIFIESLISAIDSLESRDFINNNNNDDTLLTNVIPLTKYERIVTSNENKHSPVEKRPHNNNIILYFLRSALKFPLYYLASGIHPLKQPMIINFIHV